MTKALTISKLAYNIFNRDYLDKEILLNNKQSIYDEIKLAYYGGITEVYKPYGENLYYYDVNSLYPFVALQDMPGIHCIKKNFINKDVDIYDIFGFFYCEIESNYDYVGLLPVRDRSGIKYPNGKWTGWYFSEQLKYAKSNGYKIKVIKGYDFNRQPNVFKSYIEKLHKLKSNADNKSDRYRYKLLLNSLLGRFGLDIKSPVTELVDEESFKIINTLTKQTSPANQIYNRTLVSYIPGVDKELCNTLDIDETKARDYLTKYKIKEIQDIPYNISVAISAAVTSYGRIHMSIINRKILELGGKIYYSDTDSIVTDIELELVWPEMVHPKEIGKLKREYFVKKGYFISGKTYCLLLKDNVDIKTKSINIKDSKERKEFEKNVILKAKGMKSSYLCVNDYIKMWKGESIDSAVKFVGLKDYEDGSVTIKKENNIKLNIEGYTSREKVYENIWVDTKPLLIYKDKYISNK